MLTGVGITIIACLVACAALVVCEYRGWRPGRAISKITASTAFVALALQLDAVHSAYGRVILAALVLSWVGDVFLLSHRNRLFLLGITSFLLAHVAFSVAFSLVGVSLPALLVGLAAMAVIGASVLAWLWKHLDGFYRVAVGAYVLAIVAMCAFAIAASAASGNWLLAGGAIAFAVSDISVARDRFVAHRFINRLWGLPLYYVAQVILALSIQHVAVAAA